VIGAETAYKFVADTDVLGRPLFSVGLHLAVHEDLYSIIMLVHRYCSLLLHCTFIARRS